LIYSDWLYWNNFIYPMFVTHVFIMNARYKITYPICTW